MSYPVFPPHQPGTRLPQHKNMDANYPTKVANPRPWFRRKLYLLLIVFLILALALGLGLGLGLGLKSSGNSDDSGNANPTPEPTPSSPPTSNGPIWKPAVGSTWQIILENSLPTSLLSSLSSTWSSTSIFDIDLFTNPVSTFTAFHGADKKVICYFSAGSYEPNRPDSGEFPKSDIGDELVGWPGEYWLNTSSAKVRSIMLARLDLAKTKGCDGVDPDNVDGYDNKNGLGLTTATAISYLEFLSDAAHSRGLSIGLKNAGGIVSQVLSMVQWEVNEQCVQYNECALFRPFIDDGKPVFGIEYPSSAPSVSSATKDGICSNKDSKGFSTLLKEMDLGVWVEAC